jgi:hypothetical protein
VAWPHGRLSLRAHSLQDGRVVDELPEDPTLIMQVLLDIRRNTSYIIELLQEEDENGQEEANDP